MTTDPEVLRKRDEEHQRKLAILSGQPDPFWTPPKVEPAAPELKEKPAPKKGRTVRDVRAGKATSARRTGGDQRGD